MKSYLVKILIFITIIIIVFLGWKYDISQYLSINYLKGNLEDLQNFSQENFVLSLSLFMLIYIISTALSFPGATVLTLAGGAIFGFGVGLITTSFASTIGATVSFLLSRCFFKTTIENKFSERYRKINAGVAKDGAFYLLSLRLIPVFPFFLVNALMGLTSMGTLKYFFVSMIGMLPGTAAYVYAGLSLSSIESLKDIVSPQMLISFTLLGLVPLLSKFSVKIIQKNKIYRNYKKPNKFDYNLVAIGGGAAGLVSTYIGAAVNAKVALIEKHKMGGDCLNTGCVPSKAILKSAAFIHGTQNAKKYGISRIFCEFDFKDIMDRVKNVISKIEPHDSIQRYEALGVDCITGKAKIISPWEIEVNNKILTTKNIILATGASPFVPPIKGIDSIDYLTSDTLWNLSQLPKKFVILGAGPIGLEMAQAFSRLGSEVHVVEMGSQIMSKEDADVAHLITKQFSDEGIKLHLNTKALEFKKENKTNILVCETSKGEIEICFDKVLIAVGRKARVKGFGLEALGVELRDNGFVLVNEFMQTNFPNIFACGDVAGNFQLTHTASHEAWYAAVNSLFGRFKKFKLDKSAIPWATYTSPEVATVGLNEKALQAQGIAYEVYKYEIDDLDRAIADGNDQGFVKVILKPGTDKILGVSIVASNASELLMEFTSAMKNKLGLSKILGTIHPYPTMSEANKYAAGVWKQKTKPKKLLNFVRKYHTWERGE